MSVAEIREWEAHFLLEDFRADYRTACIVWCQTNGKKMPYRVMQDLFPEYAVPEKPTPWTQDDQARFDVWFANVRARLEHADSP